MYMIMNFDDISNTGLRLGLDLGLGLHDQYSESNYMKIDDQRKRESKKKNEDDPSKCNYNKAYPSLTLGPIIVDDDDDEANDHQLASKIEASSPSPVSSFSNSSSIKKERDQFLGEEVEKVPSRSRDVDEDGNQRKKLRLTKDQSALLEENFKEHSTLNPKQKQELATKLNLRARQVEVWFQNRRARTKLKQTELDCELLRKCCETLTEENKRLQKELQELKSMHTIAPVAGPFYMQIPAAAATLTTCPSCERICGGNINNNNIGPSPPKTTTTLLIGSKTHRHRFYKSNYPFTHSSSATC